MMAWFTDEYMSWWRHQMETFSTLLALCVGNSPVTGEFPSQRPGTWSFDVFFDLRLNKWLSKPSWGWWFEMPWHSLLWHCNASLSLNKLMIAQTLFHWIYAADRAYDIIRSTHMKLYNLCWVMWIFEYMLMSKLLYIFVHKCKFSNAFSWMTIFEFRLKFQWSLFLRVHLTIFQHWFR